MANRLLQLRCYLIIFGRLRRSGEYVIADTSGPPLEIQTKAIRRFIITEKATTACTFNTLLRHYAKRSLNVKLGPRRNYHKGRVAIRHYANQTCWQGPAVLTSSGNVRLVLVKCNVIILKQSSALH